MLLGIARTFAMMKLLAANAKYECDETQYETPKVTV